MKLGAWFTFLKMHTSNLTQVGAMLGPLLAGVRDIPTLITFALWGFLYHAWGFTENNIQDYEYDLKDPAKQHFALIKGEIPLSTAKNVNHILFVLTLFGGVMLTNLKESILVIGPHWIPLIFLFMSMSTGMLYNRLCKKSLTAPLFIAIAFTSVPLFTYFCRAQELNLPIILVSIYTIFLMLFQIAFEGYLKDLESDPVNLLRAWGAKIVIDESPKLNIGRQAYFWGTLKIVNMMIGLILLLLIDTSAYAEVLFFFMWMGTLIVFYKLVDIKYDNKKVTSNAARMEILTYFALILALQGILDWTITITLVIYPIVWFVVFNRLTWGSRFLNPKV